MEAPWTLSNSLISGPETTPIDSIEASPRSMSHANAEAKHFAASRRSSAPFENPYARAQPQYSVQGSTSTPNSVGPSSGSVSPDGSTRQGESNGMVVEWVAKPMEENFEGQPTDVNPRYCYVLHGQHSSTLPTSDNRSVLPANCLPHRPMHLVLDVTTPTSFRFSSSGQRSTSVPRQLNDAAQTPARNDNKSASKPTKRKSSQEPNRQLKKPAAPRDPTKCISKSGISALTRRRLRIVQRPGETMSRTRLPLAELTVEDLKTLCRKRQFPISGTKADLYKRLQPIEDQLDIEAMLLEAIEEEDMRFAQVNNVDDSSLKTGSEPTATAYTTATTLLGSEHPSTQSEVNQFDVAISDYLMQHQKQLNQQLSRRPMTTETSDLWSSSDPATTKSSSDDKIPSFSHLPPLVRLVSRKANSADGVDYNQKESTFSYAQMGSGGQFTLETTNESPPTQTTRHIPPNKLTVESSNLIPLNVQSDRQFDSCCVKCTERESASAVTESDSNELQRLIKELALSPVKAASDNSTLTAKILALHEKVIGAQTAKLRSMAAVLSDSQLTLRCQQRLIETARREAQKVSSQHPSPIDSLVRRVDVSGAERQHAKQTDEIRRLQQTHQRLKNEQETLSRSEVELQEEIHVEQAVEDVARLIRTNRRTALLIVQLVHKFQCDRMRELDQKPETTHRVPTANVPLNARTSKTSTGSADVISTCGCARRSEAQHRDLTVVVIDESDEETTTNERATSHSASNVEVTPSPKRKVKSNVKSNGKKQTQRSDQSFAQKMEDIFQAVIREPDEVVSCVESSTHDQATRLQDDSYENKKTGGDELPAEFKANDEVSCEYAEAKIEGKVMATNRTVNSKLNSFVSSNGVLLHHMHPDSDVRSPFLVSNSFPIQLGGNSVSYSTASGQMHTPTANYQNGTSEVDAENTNSTAYLHRRAFLQEKRQTLCEQLQRIDQQQRRNELRNPYGQKCETTEEGLSCGLGDLNVDELYNCDLEPFELGPPASELHTPVPATNEPPVSVDNSYSSNFHSTSLQLETTQTETFKLSPSSYFSPHTFPQMHSNDFEDILDLIHSGESRWCDPTGQLDVLSSDHRLSTDVDSAQATHAIYQELRQTDNQFQQFPSMHEFDSGSWSDSMVVQTPRAIVYGECGP